MYVNSLSFSAKIYYSFGFGNLPSVLVSIEQLIQIDWDEPIMELTNKQTRKWRFAAVAFAVACTLSACGGKSNEGGAGAAQQAPAPVVGVVTVHPSKVTVGVDLPARLESRRTAEVRAQVSGIIQKRLFQEGTYVRAGQPLFQVDAAVYTAALDSARAQLASAQAALAKADADVARYQPLVAADAISKQEYDAAVTAKRSAAASVKAAQAAVRSAQINVGYSRISAPISGYIGQAMVSEGALVTANGTTVLATIQQTDPMYVNITQSASNVMKLRQQIAAGQVQAVDGAVPVDIVLEDGTVYAQKGRLLFADPTVDESTGQVLLRAEVPNPDNVLMPNLYVRVKLPQAAVDNAFVVPQQAVSRGKTNTVTVVNADGSMAVREVTIAGQQGQSWIITSGLKDGDKVVVEGTMIAGMMQAKKVTPKEWQPGAASASAVQAAGK